MSLSLTGTTPEQILAITQELERQKNSARDYVASSKDLAVTPDGKFAIDLGALTQDVSLGVVTYDIGDTAHQQLSDKLQVPLAYYKRCRDEAPALLSTNINYWLGAEADAKNRHFLCRTIDGRLRALLSSKFRVLDPYDLFFETYKVTKDVGAVITSASLTEDRFYMKALHPEWQERLEKQFTFLGGRGGHRGNSNDFTRLTDGGEEIVIPGVIVSTSPTGKGRLQAEPFVEFVRCSNGLITEKAFSKVHVGRSQELGFLSAEAIEADNRAVWLQVRDLIRATFDRDAFKKIVASLNDTAEQEIAEPVKVIDAVVKHYDLSDDDKQAILNEFIAPQSRDTHPGSTVFGVLQAVTARAHAYNDDPNRQYEFARIGGEILANGLPK